MKTLSLGCILAFAGALSAAPVIFQSAGPNGADIQASLDAYRAALGGLNLNNPVVNNGGRREINWDGVPAAASSPNAFPGNFFNGSTPGRARGALFTTPGVGFEVSDGTDFSNIDPSYAGLFEAFSPAKLFTPVGSNITDVHFFLPSDQTTPAVSRGFGVVFSDVDLANTTSMEYFDILGNSLGTFYAPATAGNQTFSFLGVTFDDNTRVGRVRITMGNAALGGLETSTTDLVTMDDFIYGEPENVVPEPGTWMMLSGGVAAIALGRKRRSSGI